MAINYTAETEKRKQEYNKKARRIARQIGVIVKVTFVDQSCPPWSRCAPDHHIHGDRYRVRLKKGNAVLEFDCWNSYNDKMTGIKPDYYDILTCVAADASCPANPDAVAEEYGPMKPSQAIAVARHARKLQTFFTPEELNLLATIDN